MRASAVYCSIDRGTCARNSVGRVPCVKARKPQVRDLPGAPHLIGILTSSPSMGGLELSWAGVPLLLPCPVVHSSLRRVVGVLSHAPHDKPESYLGTAAIPISLQQVLEHGASCEAMPVPMGTALRAHSAFSNHIAWVWNPAPSVRGKLEKSIPPAPLPTGTVRWSLHLCNLRSAGRSEGCLHGQTPAPKPTGSTSYHHPHHTPTTHLHHPTPNPNNHHSIVTS